MAQCAMSATVLAAAAAVTVCPAPPTTTTTSTTIATRLSPQPLILFLPLTLCKPPQSPMLPYYLLSTPLPPFFKLTQNVLTRCNILLLNVLGWVADSTSEVRAGCAGVASGGRSGVNCGGMGYPSTLSLDLICLIRTPIETEIET